MRSRETLLRRYLTRQGISVHQYRAWVGAKGQEPVEHFFAMNPGWEVGKWKAVVRENASLLRSL